VLLVGAVLLTEVGLLWAAACVDAGYAVDVQGIAKMLAFKVPRPAAVALGLAGAAGGIAWIWALVSASSALWGTGWGTLATMLALSMGRATAGLAAYALAGVLVWRLTLAARAASSTVQGQPSAVSSSAE
jgi:hypothetical protein